MSWNNGYKRKKFEQEQKAQAKEYRKCGMNEEQIQAMYLQDLQEYRNNRVHAIHIQSIEELEGNGEESRNALHKKFLLSMTCTMDMSECGRYGWILSLARNKIQLVDPLNAHALVLIVLPESFNRADQHGIVVCFSKILQRCLCRLQFRPMRGIEIHRCFLIAFGMGARRTKERND